MASVLVVADDLTGANATGARFARAGLRAVTLGEPDVAAEMASRYDVVVVNTDSRHAAAETASRRVQLAVAACWPVQLVVKRTDTTLRGNVGSETEAALTAVRERAGDSPPVRGLVVPAFPASGRATVDGIQLLDGVPLERTELAHDPLNPMTTSVVTDVLAQQTSLGTRRVPLATVARAGEELLTALRGGAADADVPLLVCDALTDDHVVALAQAAAELERAGEVRWLNVDPGPAGVALATALGLSRETRPPPALVVSGSATELTRRQLSALVAERPAEVIRLDIGRPLTDEIVDGLARRVIRALDHGTLVCLCTALGPDDVVRIDHDSGRQVPAVLARVVRRAMDSRHVGGLYLTGGDVTAAVLAELGVRGLEVEDEVVPLAVAGSAVGGPYDGMPVVTKGGLVGDDRTALACLIHLEAAVAARMGRRHRRTADTDVTPLPGGRP